MLLDLIGRLAVLAVFSLLLIDGHAVPMQSPAEHRLVEGSSVTMTCQLSSGTVVHWYRQLPGEPPKRILYMTGNSPTFDYSNDRQKFQVQRNPSNSVLKIEKSTRRDTGTYYCAYWYYQAIQKVSCEVLHLRVWNFSHTEISIVLVLRGPGHSLSWKSLHAFQSLD
uniref:Ig-like domain-containing protein n=1 Tax=Gallus gallus TaxID=9031 RepID=A0A8V0Z4J9_CHICK